MVLCGVGIVSVAGEGRGASYHSRQHDVQGGLLLLRRLRLLVSLSAKRGAPSGRSKT